MGSPWLQGVVALVLVPVLSLVSRIRVRGRERLPEGGYILAPNHPSVLDPLFAALPVLPRRLHFMGMAELWRRPVPAWVMSRVGGFPIVRGSWDRDAFVTAASVLERGRVLVMFPEGGVSPPDGYRPAKPGIGHIAHVAGATVVPLHLSGTRRLYRPWTWPKVVVTVGEPIVVEADPEPTRERSQATAERVLAAIEGLGAVASRAHARHLPPGRHAGPDRGADRAHPRDGRRRAARRRRGGDGDRGHRRRPRPPHVARARRGPGRRPRRHRLLALQARAPPPARRRPVPGRRRRRHLRRPAARLPPHPRPVRGRVGGADADHRPRVPGRRRRHAPRRRLQAAHVALRVPGPRCRRPEDPRGGARGDRPARRHRAHRPARHRRGGRVRRLRPGRRAQHAALPAADRARPLTAARPAQARDGRVHRRLPARRGVHPARGQRPRRPLRARHPREVHARPVLPGPRRRDRPQGAHPPAGHRRPVARRRPPRAGRRRWPWPPPPPAPTA